MKLSKIIKEKFSRLIELDLKSKDFIRPQSVKEALNINYNVAISLLNLAEKFGYIKKRFNVLSPVDETVVGHFYNENEIPDVVYDDEHSEDETYAFIKNRDQKKYVEVVYEYID